MPERERMQQALLRRAAAGELDPVAVVRLLAGPAGTDDGVPAATLLAWLEEEGTPEADALADRLNPVHCAEIRHCRELVDAGGLVGADMVRLMADLPTVGSVRGFADQGFGDALAAALRAQLDRLALAAKGIEGNVGAKLAREVDAHRATLSASPGVWARLLPPTVLAERLLAEPGRVAEETDRKALAELVTSGQADPIPVLPPRDDWRFRLRSCGSRIEARDVVDKLCLWPTREMAEVLPQVLEESWQRRRAVQVLVWRFGMPKVDSWETLCSWLAAEAEHWQQLRLALEALCRQRMAELLLLWCDGRKRVPPEAVGVLRRQCAGAIAGTRPLVLQSVYGAELTPEERKQLVPRTVPPPLPSSVPVAPQPVVVPVEPPPPTVWQQYLRPFLAENWLMVAGILGVLAGVSVLVYRYWQATWIIRYVVVQGLLLAGTMVPARIATWLERQDAKLHGTALLLAAAAVLLVPVNVLCPLMLAGGKGGVATMLSPGLGLGLLVGFSWWLQRVLGHALAGPGRRLGWSLSGMAAGGFGALLLMSLLGAPVVPVTLGVLPYLLLAAAAWGVRALPEEGGETPLATFIGVALGGTFLQLVGWAHLLSRTPFSGAAWAPALVLLGALVLGADCRLNRVPEGELAPGRVAYAGFALVLLGLLLGLQLPWVRPGVLVLAGVVWLGYGTARPHPAHAWIGIPLVAIGVAAVAYTPAFPSLWRPAVPLLAVLVLEPAIWRRRGPLSPALGEALGGTQSVCAGAAVVAAVLSQLHYRNDPRIALAVIAGSTASFAWFAYREQSARWVRVAACAAVVALPYAGCADLTGNFGQANTMAFGVGVLSWLWIGLVQWRGRTAYLRHARSTVLVVHGGCAMLAMAIRLLVQRLDPEAGLISCWMDTAGPILVLGALILATYWSRSLLPAGMAAVTGAIFAPEMRAFLVRVLPWVHWGTGLGSACWAVVLFALCFRLRAEARLRDLGPGDPYWERGSFPWLRADHTLFTIPTFLTAVFLCARVEIYVWLRPYLAGGTPNAKTCLALVLSGLAWLVGAAYLERTDRPGMRLCGYLGVFWLGWGIAQLYLVLSGGSWHAGMLRFVVALQIMHAIGLLLSRRRATWAGAVMVEPARQLLLVAAVGLTFALLLWLAFADGMGGVALLALFCAGQLVWHGLRTEHPFYGWLLLAFVLVLAASMELGGKLPLADASGLHHVALYPLLVLVTVLALGIPAEPWYDPADSRGRGLVRPWLLGSGGLALVAGAGMVLCALLPHEFRAAHFWVAAGFVLLASRTNGWSVPALLAVLSAGLMLMLWGIARDDCTAMLAMGMQPWKLGLSACVLLACAHGGRWAYRRRPWLLVSPWAPYPRPSADPFVATGVALAGAGVLRQLAVPAYRDAPEQVGAPFLSALALAAAAPLQVAELVLPLLASAGVAVAAGCVLATRVVAGPWLRPLGANEVHLVALGLAVAVVLAEAVAFLAQKRWARIRFRWMCAAPAIPIPDLLALGYLVAPGLDQTNSVRCLVSGFCFLIAAVPFRRFRDVEGEMPLALASPLGLALGVASLTMAVPWLRQPQWALSALLLPALVLLVLAEVRPSRPEPWRRQNTWLVFGLAVLPVLFQVAPGLYQSLCFSGHVRWFSHFHSHALVPLVAGLVLARLARGQRHGFSACLAGPLLATGGYAVVAQWPLAWAFPSVFLPALIWLLIWAHVWLGLTTSSTVRRWLVGELDHEELRTVWRHFVWLVAQVVVLCAISRGSFHSYASAPLLAGAASVLMHVAVLEGVPWLGILAVGEVVLAIHLDFLTPSYLPQDWVIWILLGLWGGLLAADGLLRGRLRRQAAAGAQVLAPLVFAQICHWDPGSRVGLIGMAAGGLLYALSPLAADQERVPSFSPAVLLLAVPAWLVFWATAGLAADFQHVDWCRTVLASCFGLLAVAPLSIWPGGGGLARRWFGWRPRLLRQIDVALQWLRDQAEAVDLALLATATAGLFVAAVQPRLAGADVIRGVVLGALLAVGWWRTGKRRREWAAVTASLGVAFLALYLVRSWLQVTGHWQVEYDLWLGLALSTVVCGLERWFAAQPDYARRPLLALYWVLPIANTLWMLSHRLWGSDLPLIVSGIHAMQFGYLGRREQGSPYRAAAVSGTVLFCLIAFATRLHLQQAYAYIVPVCCGMLALVQLYGGRMEAQNRNTIRVLALLGMLGSTGYYVIADSQLTLVHILVLGLLCLVSIGIAGLTQVRAYLYLGFTGFVADLAALLYRVLVRLEHKAQMTLVGVLVLGTGIVLVAGSLYYKLHRDEVRDRLRRLGTRLKTWE